MDQNEMMMNEEADIVRGAFDKLWASLKDRYSLLEPEVLRELLEEGFDHLCNLADC